MTGTRGRLLCATFIDRAAELDELRAMLDLAAAGPSQAAFIAGEAGIGKSRLCLAGSEAALRRGALALYFHAAPQDLTVPCAPLMTGLRRYLRQISGDRSTSGGSHPSLQALLSGEFPELALGQGPATTVPLPAQLLPAGGMDGVRVDAQQQRRLFDTLIAALQLLGSADHGDSRAVQRLLLLIFEDLQWADDTTLDFVQYLLHTLVREAPGAPSDDLHLLVLATYRSEAVQERFKLRRTINTCVGQRLAREIELKPFPAADHRDFVSAVLGRQVSPELASLLYEHSDGNPFVTEELLSAMADTGYLRPEGDRWIQQPGATLQLPLSLCTAVLDRLANWSAADRHVLATAATVGREFEFDLVQRVTNLPEEELLAVLRRAVDQQILSEDTPRGEQLETGDERFRFRHGLTRDVILGELLNRERRMLHCAIAEALERRLELDGGLTLQEPTSLVIAKCDSNSARLAHHFLRAGLIQRARPHALAAAEWALSVGGFAEAAEHLQQSLISLEQGDPSRVPLLERLGTLRLSLLDVSQGIEMLDLARVEAINAGDRWRACAIGAETGLLLWFIDTARAATYLSNLRSDAEARFRSAEPGDETALRLYAAAALFAALSGSESRESTEPIVWAERARRLVGHLPPVAERFLYGALIGRGLVQFHNARIADGVRDIEQAISLGLRLALPHAVILARDVMVQALQEVGRDSESLAVHAQTLGYPRRAEVAWSPPSVLHAYLALGRWSEGMEVAREQLARSRQLGLTGSEALARAAMGQFLLGQGYFQDAAVELENACNALNEGPGVRWSAHSFCSLARVRASTGRVKEAAALFERCYAWWKETEDNEISIPILLEGCLFYADRADAGAARRWSDGLKEIAAATQNPVALAATGHAAGVMSHLAGDTNECMSALRVAADTWRALDRPYFEARALLRLGEAALCEAGRDARRRVEADRLLCAAADVFSRLGATPDAKGAHQTRRKAGLVSHARRRRTVADSRAPFGGLTVRERDVLHLIAEGQTNRDIARSLFIAESTAELHVSRILGKLGCTSRAQAAAWAVRHQLVSVPQQMAAIS